MNPLVVLPLIALVAEASPIPVEAPRPAASAPAVATSELRESIVRLSGYGMTGGDVPAVISPDTLLVARWTAPFGSGLPGTEVITYGGYLASPRTTFRLPSLCHPALTVAYALAAGPVTYAQVRGWQPLPAPLMRAYWSPVIGRADRDSLIGGTVARYMSLWIALARWHDRPTPRHRPAAGDRINRTPPKAAP